MFQNDYIMRQIEDFVKFISKVVAKKDINSVEIFTEKWEFSKEGLFLLKLQQMVDNGEINEAENLLFEEVEKNQSVSNLAVANLFYNYLSLVPKERLLDCNYSEQEIQEGRESINKKFN